MPSRFFDVGDNLDTKCRVSDEHKGSALFVRFIHILSKFRPTQSDVQPTKSPICLKFVPHVQAFVWCSSNLYAMFGRTHWAAVLLCVRQGTGWSYVRPICTNVSRFDRSQQIWVLASSNIFFWTLFSFLCQICESCPLVETECVAGDHVRSNDVIFTVVRDTQAISDRLYYVSVRPIEIMIFHFISNFIAHI